MINTLWRVQEYVCIVKWGFGLVKWIILFIKKLKNFKTVIMIYEWKNS